jgi:LmbE family N-acetylglucosaminyl deacetylase
MKVLFVHAHFDDFEFTAAGLFELWRRNNGKAVQRRVLVCTDGAAGHQFRTREETARVRLSEQEESARLGGYEFQLLRLPSGGVPREACLLVTRELLAALWKAIRDFEPDYLFCPPLPGDPLAGLHVDHVAIADAVRKVAYMINVPHAFTPEYPADETHSISCKVPVILNVFDPYSAGANLNDLVIDTEETFDAVCRMAWCHQSQITEWLPWVGRHNMSPPEDLQQWRDIIRSRFTRKNRDLGLNTDRFLEFFTVTGWGEIPDYEQLLRDFPNVQPESSKLDQLRRKLSRLGTV